MMMNKALFIPNGNWMEGEMADAPRADGFEFGLDPAHLFWMTAKPRYVMSSAEQLDSCHPRTPNWQKSSRASRTLRIPLLFAKSQRHLRSEEGQRDGQGIVTDGVYNMNDIYQEGMFMVFGWDAMPDTSKVAIADSVFNVACDVMIGDMTAEQWRDGIEVAFEETVASK